jgi:hypothetical protein
MEELRFVPQCPPVLRLPLTTPHTPHPALRTPPHLSATTNTRYRDTSPRPTATCWPAMANVLGGGDGMMGGFPLEQWFYEMPVCTRWWMTAALSASVLVQCHIISPFQLFYSVRTVFFKSQVCLPPRDAASM